MVIYDQNKEENVTGSVKTFSKTSVFDGIVLGKLSYTCWKYGSIKRSGGLLKVSAGLKKVRIVHLRVQETQG